MPGVFVETYSPVHGASVPAWRSTRNSVGVSRTRHSSSVAGSGAVVSSVAMRTPYVGRPVRRPASTVVVERAWRKVLCGSVPPDRRPWGGAGPRGCSPGRWYLDGGVAVQPGAPDDGDLLGSGSLDSRRIKRASRTDRN